MGGTQCSICQANTQFQLHSIRRQKNDVSSVNLPFPFWNVRFQSLEISAPWATGPINWEFQDPKMEVLYHIRPYFAGIFPYIGLIYGRYLQFRFLKWPLNQQNTPCEFWTSQLLEIRCQASSVSTMPGQSDLKKHSIFLAGKSPKISICWGKKQFW